MDLLVTALEDDQTRRSCLLLHDPLSDRTLVACGGGSAQLYIRLEPKDMLDGIRDLLWEGHVVRRVEPQEFNQVYRATKGTHVRSDFLGYPIPSLVSVVEEFYVIGEVPRPVNRLVF